MLAGRLGAGFLLLLTDVDAVERGWGTERAARIDEATHRRRVGKDAFESGSMEARVEAVCRFVGAPGGVAVIGALGDTVALVRGGAGTRVAPSPAL